MADRTLPEMYHDLIAGSIDHGGVHPHHAIALQRNGHSMMFSIDGDEHQMSKELRRVMALNAPAELIFGTDRFACDGQGTVLADLVAGAHYADGIWRPFIIEYRHSPRLVLPINWENGHWNPHILGELHWMVGELPVQTGWGRRGVLR